MAKSSPPPPPDYVGAAQAQGQANIDAATQQSRLNNPNVVSPYGTQTYYTNSQNPTEARTTLERQIADLQAQMPVWENWDWRYANGLASGPYASERAAQWFTNTTNSLNDQLRPLQEQLSYLNEHGQVPQDNRPTLVQTLSPEQQAIFNQENANKLALGQLGAQGISSAQGIIGTPFNLGWGGTPSYSTMGSTSGPTASVSKTPPSGTSSGYYQGGSPTFNEVTGTYGVPSLWGNATGGTKNTGTQNLAMNGASAPSSGWSASMNGLPLPAPPGSYQNIWNQSVNAAMQRPTEDYLKAADQKNSDLVAAGIRPGSVAYGNQMQMLQRGLNDARAQAILGAGTLTQQAYAQDADRRRQAIAELLSQRSVPLNEITALMSGAQVSNPFSMPGYAQNSQVAPSPLFAAQNALSQYNTDVYNTRAAQQSNLQSGLFGLGGAGLLAFV